MDRHVDARWTDIQTHIQTDRKLALCTSSDDATLSVQSFVKVPQRVSE